MVQAVNSSGSTGPWSSVATTDTSGRAVLVGPIVSTAGRPTIEWTEVLGASRYVLQVTNIQTNASVIREESLTGLSFTTTSALPAGSYRTWVRAISATGTPGLWSLHQDFVV